jgi:hypothetical protein
MKRSLGTPLSFPAVREQTARAIAGILGVFGAIFGLACADDRLKETNGTVQTEVRESSESGNRVLRETRSRVRAALPPGVAQGFFNQAAGAGPEQAGAGPKALRPKFAPSTGLESASLVLPERASRAAALEDRVSGVALDVVLDGARDVQAEPSDGYLVYERAHSSGATLLHRPLLEGLEDYLSFERRPALPVIAYRVKLTKRVAGLRLVENSLEFLDRQGAPRLRVAPPYVVDADGATTYAKLEVDGCSVDHDSAAPWDRPVTAPGASTCTVRVSWNADAVKYPAVLDPRWTTTANMATARQEHTATLLSNGKVLVAGGRVDNGTGATASAELYDPTSKTWTGAGNIVSGSPAVSTPRRLHTAVQLPTSSNMTTSGRVFVAGGITGTTSVSTTSLYNPATNTWASGPSMVVSGCANCVARHEHTATLRSGNVIVIGGVTNTTVRNSAAIYNPSSGSGTWTGVSNTMASARRGHTATLLNVPGNTTLNNKILVVGGNNGGSPAISVNTSQIFDGTTWNSAVTLPSSLGREGQTATALADARVLVAGGKRVTSTSTTFLQSTIIFSPATGTGTWSSPAALMQSRRIGHAATLLPTTPIVNGSKQVLLVGGSSTGSDFLSSAEVWDGSTWALTSALTTATPTALTAVRAHTATLVGNKFVLVAGGLKGGTPPVTSAAGLYDVSFGLACTAPSQCSTGFCVNGVCCDSACTNSCSACNLAGSVGVCSPKPNGSACEDGNFCTQFDTCQAGTCVSGGAKTNGSGCDDGNLCTQLDTCQFGTCVGGDAKVCPPADQCRPSATCNPSTGLCPVAAMGTSCTDNNVCNGAEACDDKGNCKAGTPLTCVASAGCVNPSTCHPTNGCQAGPARPGQTCTTTNVCATPGVCPNLISWNPADPTPDMEDHCARQRAVAVRFVDFTDQPAPDRLDTYAADFIRTLNETYAKACMSFYPRKSYTVRNTIFSDFYIDFDWGNPAHASQWPLAIPQNPQCAFNLPTGQEPAQFGAGTAAGKVMHACGIADELIVHSSNYGAGAGNYPRKWGIIESAANAAHEVGHNLSLGHAWGELWPKPHGPPQFERDLRQIQADYWDMHYQAGGPSTFNRYFTSYDDATGAGVLSPNLLRPFDTLGIYLPGIFTDPSDNTTTYEFKAPDKTGTGPGGSCANPPDGGAACTIRDIVDSGADGNLYCYYCEFRRMYEAWNGQGSFPPPNGKPLGLVFAPGQPLLSWRSTGAFQPGFAGFEVERVGGDGNNGPVMAGFAPRRTKLQNANDPNRRRNTLQTMSYGVGWYPPGPDGNISPGLARRPHFDAISDSQAVLVRNALKADMKMDPSDPPPFDDGDPLYAFNRGKFGNYPARGSWEKIGQHLDTSGAPSIVGTSDGVLIAARTNTGEVVFRRWRYGDAPWASQSGGTTLINGPAWKRVLPTQTSSTQGVISGTYRAADGVFDIAMRNSSGPTSWTEIAGVSDTGAGMRGWEHMVGDLRGSPVLLNHQGSEGARTSLFVLGGGPNPNDYIYVNQWRRTEPAWTGWFAFAPLPSPMVVDGLEAVARPNGDVDLAVLTEDGRHHFALMNVDLGRTGWLDLGNPNFTAPVGTRLSIASFVTPSLQIDVVTTDGYGTTYHKRYTPSEGWTPSETGWNFLGYTYHGRPRVSHNANGDTDIVARDTTNNTVRFRRYRQAMGLWSPESDWFDLGGETVTEPIAVARPALPDVVDIFIVRDEGPPGGPADGSLWHRAYVVPGYEADPLRQHHDLDYDSYCGCGFVTNATAKLPRARLGTAACPCSR